MRRRRYSLRSLLGYAPIVLSAVLLFAIAGYGQDPSGRPTDPGKGGKKPPRRPPVKVEPQPITVTLTVLSDPPESEVYLNGESRGATNVEGKLQIEKLALGRYSVEVRKEGYQTILRPFDAGTQSPTLVFKMEPDFTISTKQFDSLVAAGKIIEPEGDNALQFVRNLGMRYPDRPEVAQMRGALAARFAEKLTPVVTSTAKNWRAATRDEISGALDAATLALDLKPDDTRIKAEAAYLKGALAFYDWQRGGSGEQGAENGGGLSAARAAFENAVGLQESFAAARYMLGVVLLASGDGAGAEASFIRTLQLEPRWVLAQVSLGSAYQAQGRYKEAIDGFRKAIEIDSNQSAAYAGLGLARFSKGEKDGVKDIERAIKMDSNAALPHLYLGIIYSQSKNKKDWPRAEQALKKAIEMNPQNIEFQNSKAEQLLADLQKRPKK